MRTQGEGHVEEATGFEVGIVVPRLSRAAAAGATDNCVARLVRELEGAGLLVERVRGVSAEFIKVRDPAPACRCCFLLLFYILLFLILYLGYAQSLSGRKQQTGDTEEREPSIICLVRKLCSACCLFFFLSLVLMLVALLFEFS
jgi:hypothetical protein